MVEVPLDQNVLDENDRIARDNRALLARLALPAVNLIGSPGSGKTTLLEATLRRLAADGLRPAAIEGDLETSRDADRIAALNVPAVQINTRGGCHLDAAQVRNALHRLTLHGIDILFIENVGNLVCPTAYDLGESAKVIVLSVAEGDDKPAKYAGAFDVADAVIVSKTDLLPHVDFSIETAQRDVARIRPAIAVLPLSARTGQGVQAWIDWLLSLRKRP